MDIVGETLVIDARPLTRTKPVEVEAVYRLSNRDAAVSLDLTFVDGGETDDFRAWIDGEPIPGCQPARNDLPDSWRRPSDAPGLNGGESLRLYGHGQSFVHNLRVVVPSGRHEIKVAYGAKPGHNASGNFPALYAQFAYVLAPARSWRSFGKLDVTVHVPAGWDVAVSLPLNREGDTFTGQFDGVPADSLTATLRPPVPAAYWAFPFVGAAGVLLASIAGHVVCRRVGERAGREGWTSREIRDRASRLGFARSMTICVSGFAAVLGPRMSVPGGLGRHNDWLLAFVGWVIIGLMIWAGPGAARVVKRAALAPPAG